MKRLWNLLFPDRCGDLRAEVESLKLDLSRLESEIGGLMEEADECEADLIGMEAKAKAAETSAIRLQEMLDRSIRPPAILFTLLGSMREVDPWKMTQEQWKGVQPLHISDDIYLAYSESDWMMILDPVRAEVKRVLGFPKAEVNDCDNWSNAMIFLVQEVFRRGGQRRQGAFMKLASKAHSYCGFMMPDMSIRVYDPMNGKVVGWLGETGTGGFGEDTYRTEQAFLLS